MIVAKILNFVHFVSGFPKNSEVQAATGRWGNLWPADACPWGATNWVPFELYCSLEFFKFCTFFQFNRFPTDLCLKAGSIEDRPNASRINHW